MIRRVTLKRFKRFAEETFDLPGHLVLAGPNNSGKTTLLQAIATWSSALERWREQNDFNKHNGSYTKVPITRHDFAAVPLRRFDLLWTQRDYKGTVEIEIMLQDGNCIAMELLADSTEQVFVRPTPSADKASLRSLKLRPVFVPPMSGLATAEPVYQTPKIQELLGQGRPGEVLRNLLVEAHQTVAWEPLVAAMRRLFDCELLAPNGGGASIIAEYQHRPSGKAYDIGSAGSGFLQVLMLLTFLHTRPGAVLLVDEPDAHLHLVLQDAIYGELLQVAAANESQLILATHSEIIINAVAPSELCLLLDKPRLLSSVAEREQLKEALAILTSADIVQALEMPGVLYLEDYTDLEVLRTLAARLGHRAVELLTTRLFWRKTVIELRPGTAGIRDRDHHKALQLIRKDLPALELVDGDARPEIQSSDITGKGLQRLRWRRYEIESYLVHPAALARFVEKQLGPGAAKQGIDDLNVWLEGNLPPNLLKEPLGDHPFLATTKARTLILPPALAAGGLPAFPYTRFHELAAVMLPEEIHPEVSEKLDLLCKAFNQ